MAFDAMQEDEIIESVFNSLDSKTRNGMKAMIATERKQQKENS